MSNAESTTLIFLLQEVDRELNCIADFSEILLEKEDARRLAEERIASLQGRLDECQAELSLREHLLTQFEQDLVVRSERLRRAEANVDNRERDHRIAQTGEVEFAATHIPDVSRARRSLSRARMEHHKAVERVAQLNTQVKSDREEVGNIGRLIAQTRAEVMALSEDVRRARSSYGQRRTLERRRNDLVARLGTLAPIYERARLNLDGRLTALADGGVCSGCLKRINVSILTALTLGRITQSCPNCGRVLSLPPTASDSSQVARMARRSSRIKWEILPTGWWNDEGLVEQIARELGVNSKWLDVKRLQMLASLKPARTYAGRHMGHRRYFVFEFDRIAVAECPMRGNALYLAGIHEWRRAFQLSKRGALRAGARRIPHNGSWFERVKHLVG